MRDVKDDVYQEERKRDKFLKRRRNMIAHIKRSWCKYICITYRKAFCVLLCKTIEDEVMMKLYKKRINEGRGNGFFGRHITE